MAMNCLEARIVKDGVVKEGNVLKVDSFMNHPMDNALMNELGKEFNERFKDRPINKILTIEASGIGIACMAARHFGVPVVFAKKQKPSTMEGMLTASVHSFTKWQAYPICISKEFLKMEDKILFIDDFLAYGNAAMGIMEIVEEVGAEIVGMGFLIEKEFQNGAKFLREKGMRVESLAVIESLENHEIKFKE